jgi:translation initiation factor IF-2
MAEDQDKKPKATLIKHKQEEQRPEGEKPKRRVVVKKKKAPKKPAATEEPPKKTEEAAAPSAEAGPKPTAKEADTQEKPPAKEAAPKPPAETSAETEAAKPAAKSETAPAAEKASEAPQKKEPRKDKFAFGDERPRADSPIRFRAKEDLKPEDLEPARMSRPKPKPAEAEGSGAAARGRSAGRGPAPRGPQARGPAGRGPASRGPAGPRPGGPGRPAPAPAADTRKPGKKFFKSKKKEQYPKRDRHQEKELQYKPKRSAPKANPVPKEIDIMEVISVSELAKKMNLKASDLIGKLMSMGTMVTINQQIDAETAEILASEYGCKVNIVSLYDETIIEKDAATEDEQEPRPPVITIMGHVDHGKTKLLDAIRTTDVVAGEFGGITQHIGAYQVEHEQGKLTFLDTPGHEAFTLMRARGAQITDIVILVVAADDGVMPQTKEAIDHAREANVPIIVAVNKVDLPSANPDRVKQELSEYGLVPEAWGGDTIFADVSALKKEGIDDLLESVFLQAEFLELKSNYDVRAEGRVIESRIDQGRGTVSTVLVQRGTLRVGEPFVAGVFPGRVRAMFNDRGERVEEANPSMPVEIIGLTGIPNAGDPFQVTENEKLAREVGEKRQELRKVEDAQNVKKVTLDNLYDSIQEGEIQELKVIIKGDVHGSVEALQSSLERLSTPAIRLRAIRSAAGAINEDDVMLASASNAILVGFHVRATPRAQSLAEQEKVEIRKYSIIYDAVEDIRSAMEGMLAPEIKEETVATVEVRDTFKVPKIGVIAGCYVTEGTVRRNAQVRVYREGVELYTGRINSLKRFKDDVRQVESGYECGIGIENYNDLKVGDILEVFEKREIAKKLEDTKKQNG